MDVVSDRRLVPIGHVDALGPCDYTAWRPADAPETVAAVWRSEVRESGRLLVVPDGCVEVVRSSCGAVEVWGPCATVSAVDLDAGSSYVGVRLRSGAAGAVLGLPAHELARRVVGPAQAGLARDLTSLDLDTWLTRALQLAARGADAWRGDVVACVAPALLRRRGSVVADVAERLDMSERQLHGRFRAANGLSPAGYRRVVRVRRALHELRGSGPGTTVTEVAHRSGFTDHAHLTREVVAMTGTTPTLLRG